MSFSTSSDALPEVSSCISFDILDDKLWASEGKSREMFKSSILFCIWPSDDSYTSFVSARIPVAKPRN